MRRYTYSCENPRDQEYARRAAGTIATQWCCGCSRFVPIELFSYRQDECNDCAAKPKRVTKNNMRGKANV